MKTGLSHKSKQTQSFKRNGLTAGIRSGYDEKLILITQSDINGNRSLLIQQRMHGPLQVDDTAVGKDRLAGAQSFCKAGLGENEVQLGKELQIFGYIIGAYRYVSKPLSVGLRTEEKIEIVVETEKGAVILEQGGTTRFPAGNEINGLFSARITALTTNVNVIYGGQFQLSMDLEGRKPSDGRTLVYKLYDSDGIVLESNSAYFTKNTAQLYFIDADVMAAGRYVLRFEELD